LVSKILILFLYLVIILTKQVIVSLSLDPVLVQRIDSQRGDIPRSRYIQRILERDMNGGQKVVSP